MNHKLYLWIDGLKDIPIDSCASAVYLPLVTEVSNAGIATRKKQQQQTGRHLIYNDENTGLQRSSFIASFRSLLVDDKLADCFSPINRKPATRSL